MPKEKKNIDSSPNIIIVNQKDFSTKSPVIDPLKGGQNADYVYFGDDNLFPQYIVDLYNNVSIHSALINTFIRFISGDGVIASDAAKNKLNELFGQPIKQTRQQVSTSLAFFDQIYYNIKTNPARNIAQAEVLDNTTIRAGKTINPLIGIENYKYSLNWAKATGKRTFIGRYKIYEPITLPAFDANNIKRNNAYGFIWDLRFSKKPGEYYYTFPRYIGALNDLERSARVSNLLNTSIKNGMVGNTHIHVYEDLSDPELRRKYEDGLNRKFAGDNNAGKIVLTWSIDPDNKVELNNLQANTSHEMFDMIHRNINEHIIAANQVPPFLSNISVKSGFSDTGVALRESIEYFQNSIIRPYQELIESNWQQLLLLSGLSESLSEIKIKPLNPINLMGTEGLLRTAVTVDEYRQNILKIDAIGDERGNLTLTEMDKYERN